MEPLQVFLGFGEGRSVLVNFLTLATFLLLSGAFPLFRSAFDFLLDLLQRFMMVMVMFLRMTLGLLSFSLAFLSLLLLRLLFLSVFRSRRWRLLGLSRHDLIAGGKSLGGLGCQLCSFSALTLTRGSELGARLLRGGGLSSRESSQSTLGKVLELVWRRGFCVRSTIQGLQSGLGKLMCVGRALGWGRRRAS